MAVPYLRKEHAPCRFCGGPVQKRDYESYKQHAARLTCSKECAHGARVARMMKRPARNAHRGGVAATGHAEGDDYAVVPFVPTGKKGSPKEHRRRDQEQDRLNREALAATSRIVERSVFHPVSLRCNPGIVWLMG
jgi:hypothetical protein